MYEAMLGDGSSVDRWDMADERSAQCATFRGYRPLVPHGDWVGWIFATLGCVRAARR
ncbi:hypothetical protein [Streptomyces sp. NPDC048611]|uniref:hypothetical protein n=1 Tax=unclassified Streptomyces TaxID=2593676 RepID=UPI00343149CF